VTQQQQQSMRFFYLIVIKQQEKCSTKKDLNTELFKEKRCAMRNKRGWTEELGDKSLPSSRSPGWLDLSLSRCRSSMSLLSRARRTTSSSVSKKELLPCTFLHLLLAASSLKKLKACACGPQLLTPVIIKLVMSLLW
jgi:hypothetical protein